LPAQQNWNQSREGRIRSGRNNRREQNREALGADARVIDPSPAFGVPNDGLSDPD
jgi:hypothetical protein